MGNQDPASHTEPTKGNKYKSRQAIKIKPNKNKDHKETRIYNGDKTVSSVNGVVKTRQLQGEE